MAFSWIVSPEVLQIGKVSGGLCNSNYRIVTGRRKGQSVFGASRGALRTPIRAVHPTQFHHDCTNKKSRTVNCITSTGSVSRYFMSSELH
jgi:hypothetical protein